MQKASEWILRHRKLVLILFAAVTGLSTLLCLGTRINFSLIDYLPADAPSTKALQVMEEEFTQPAPNARVYLPDVSIPQALSYKERLSSLEGVGGVSWLDDVLDLKQPLETADQSIVEAYYKDSGALLSLSADEGDAVRVVHQIREIIGEEGAVSGELVNTANAQETTFSSMAVILALLIPIVLLILLLTSRSWFEPVLFLCTIGCSILINMGTNLFLGETSFITFSVGPILQLAVSMDYAIFLLNSFARHRTQTDDSLKAMTLAMKESFSAVLASALTTILGFLVLVLMRFKIGPDLGIVLAKGILLSLVSVMIFLPALTICCQKLLDKTRHRSFVPKMGKLGKGIFRIRIPALILICLLIVPCFLAQQKNDFTYGNAELSMATRAGQDTQRIDGTFGQSVQIVVMVPRGSFGKERALAAAFETLPAVRSVISYAGTIGTTIPEEFLPSDTLSQMVSEHYSRMILDADTPTEGPQAFALVEDVRKLAADTYGGDALLCGVSVNNYDMRDTVTADNFVVSTLAIIAIGLVLLLTFRSLSIPLLLLLTIETSIWINLSVPYFTGDPICYIGFLVINTVQLGATVDYAILFTQHYLRLRRTLPKRETVVETVRQTAASILTSAMILTAAGAAIGICSDQQVVSELGVLLGRGAALSAVMVLLVLPALLCLLDRVVEKTTLQLTFWKKDRP
ncbi:efflux RND transporter permease subunit [Candidatus Soleaferrea massiliensis]|uniref:efflux RND transporter permease subunit n=1 Tax=Candidatus Soleaferrea massiliensis TaxID=1470354 RepID=UPI00058C6FCA|nr:MMPL family transporter [Candidatus Soleaferrea massiliensis]